MTSTAAPTKMKTDWIEVIHQLSVVPPAARMFVLDEVDGEEGADVVVRPVVGIVTRVVSRYSRRRPASEPRIRAVAPGLDPETQGFVCRESYAEETTLNVLSDSDQDGIWDGVGTLEEVCATNRYEVLHCAWPPSEDEARLADAKARFIDGAE